MTTVVGGACPYRTGEADRLELDPEYGRLRDSGELARVTTTYGGEAWLATSYADVKTVMADPRFSRAAVFDQDVPSISPRILTGSNILSMDPPEHTRLRRLVAKAFTSRRIEQLRPRVQEVVDGLLDRIVEQGPPADLVEELDWPLPITMICELLGVPFEDRDRFRAWSDAVLSVTAHTPEEFVDARGQLTAYLAGLVAQRRQRPTDDLLGVLVLARDELDQLTEEELVQFGLTLLVAGHETTANQIGNSVYTLLTHPDQLDRLKADPELLPGAVEEMLRFIPLGNNTGTPRIALEDIELGGGLVHAGEAVIPQGAAANRDNEVFERANELDLTREQNPHVAFGHGPHHCIGAQLARVELQVAIGSLLRRLPGLRFAVPVDEMVFKSGRLVRGLEALPVTW